MRIGGGGTLLRSAVRQSLRKNSRIYESNINKNTEIQQPRSNQVHTVQVHTTPDPYSEEMNCLMEDLPPPPRAESIDQHLNTAGMSFLH